MNKGGGEDMGVRVSTASSSSISSSRSGSSSMDQLGICDMRF